MVADRIKQTLADIHGAGVAGASGYDLIVRHARFEEGCLQYAAGTNALAWLIPADGRLLVVGAGKAAASLARGLEHVLGERIDGGCIIVKYGHGEALERIRIVEAAHPIPDGASVSGTEQLLATLEGLRPQDRVIVALTGGASALMVAPVDPLKLADKARVSELLIASGASIEEINTVRRRLSKVKGGGLLQAIEPASSLTLAISDVPHARHRDDWLGPLRAHRRSTGRRALPLSSAMGWQMRCPPPFSTSCGAIRRRGRGRTALPPSPSTAT